MEGGNMNHVIYVVAGSHKQFDDFVYNSGIPRIHFNYLSSGEGVRGIRAKRWIKVGTWYEHPNIDQILTALDPKGGIDNGGL